jgi:hypothetical protein
MEYFCTENERDRGSRVDKWFTSAENHFARAEDSPDQLDDHCLGQKVADMNSRFKERTDRDD